MQDLKSIIEDNIKNIKNIKDGKQYVEFLENKKKLIPYLQRKVKLKMKLDYNLLKFRDH